MVKDLMRWVAKTELEAIEASLAPGPQPLVSWDCSAGKHKLWGPCDRCPYCAEEERSRERNRVEEARYVEKRAKRKENKRWVLGIRVRPIWHKEAACYHEALLPYPAPLREHNALNPIGSGNRWVVRKLMLDERETE